MLNEVPNTRQIEGESRRRWFFSQEQDLYVWQDDAREITAFQLCYAKSEDEHAVYWRSDSGYAHLQVDSKRRYATPFLVADGYLDKEAVLDLFREVSINLPVEVRDFVIDHIANFPSASLRRVVG
jgi:hypothetical protein